MRPRIRRTPSDELFIALRRRHHHRFSERFLFTLQSSTVTSGLRNSEQQHFFFAEAIFDCSPKIELLSTLPLGIYLFANDGESSASLQYFLMGLGVGGTIVLFVVVILLPMLAKRITVSVAFGTLAFSSLRTEYTYLPPRVLFSFPETISGNSALHCFSSFSPRVNLRPYVWKLCLLSQSLPAVCAAKGN